MPDFCTRIAVKAVLLGLLFVTGCASSLRPPYVFNEILVHNQSGAILTAVRIEDVQRNRVFECGNVAPHGICSATFRPRPYRGNPIEISWSADGETRQVRPFVARVPDFLDQGRPVRGVLVIGAEEAEAFFEQEARELE